MENFVETRSVHALQNKIAAKMEELDKVEAEDSEVVETMTVLKKRLDVAGDTTALNEIVETLKEKT